MITYSTTTDNHYRTEVLINFRFRSRDPLACIAPCKHETLNTDVIVSRRGFVGSEVLTCFSFNGTVLEDFIT